MDSTPEMSPHLAISSLLVVGLDLLMTMRLRVSLEPAVITYLRMGLCLIMRRYKMERFHLETISCNKIAMVCMRRFKWDMEVLRAWSSGTRTNGRYILVLYCNYMTK